MANWLDVLSYVLKRGESARKDKDLATEQKQRRDEFLAAIDTCARERRRIHDILDELRSYSRAYGPCDREAAEAAIADVYKGLDMAAPQFIWFDSPLDAIVSATICNIAERLHRRAHDYAALWRNFPEDSIQYRAVKAAFPFESRLDPMYRAVRQQISTITFESSLPPFSDYLGNVGEHLLTEAQLQLRSSKPLDWWLETYERFLVRPDVNDAIKSKLELAAQFLWGLDDTAHHDLLSGASNRTYSDWSFWDQLRRRRRACLNAFELVELKIASELGVKWGPTFDGLSKTVQHCGWWWPYDDVCLMLERPSELHLELNDLHRFDEPAVVFPDGYSMYFLRDLRVDDRIAKGQFTAQDIDNTLNTELRSVMILRYGTGNYLEETNAEWVAEDRFGTLYRKRVTFGEHILVVKVINSTPEPDGSFKEYFLRVPPDMKTPREAVAWTFGMREKDYNPKIES